MQRGLLGSHDSCRPTRMVGELADGWTKQDEEEWDEAIKVMTDKLINHPGFKQTGPNKVTLAVVANIVLVQK